MFSKKWAIIVSFIIILVMGGIYTFYSYGFICLK